MHAHTKTLCYTHTHTHTHKHISVVMKAVIINYKEATKIQNLLTMSNFVSTTKQRRYILV